MSKTLDENIEIIFLFDLLRMTQKRRKKNQIICDWLQNKLERWGIYFLTENGRNWYLNENVYFITFNNIR